MMTAIMLGEKRSLISGARLAIIADGITVMDHLISRRLVVGLHVRRTVVLLSGG